MTGYVHTGPTDQSGFHNGLWMRTCKTQSVGIGQQKEAEKTDLDERGGEWGEGASLSSR